MSRISVSLPITFCLLAILLCPAASFAQSSGVGVGVKVGMNSSTIIGPLVTKATQLTGVTGGLFVSGTFSEMVGFQVEALFSQKGANAVDGRDKEKVRISYLDVPIFLRLGSLGNPDSAGAHIFGGPTLGLKLSTAATYNDAPDTTWKDSNVSGLDLGLTFGAGATLGRLGLDARYTIGMRTIDATTNPADMKNRTFSLMASYRFK